MINFEENGNFDQKCYYSNISKAIYFDFYSSPVKGAKLPKIDTIEPWDGKDGEMPVEEEIDLSDVELEDLGKEEL